MRGRLRPVARLAERYNTTFALVAHVTKSANVSRAVHKLMGTADQGNIARSAVEVMITGLSAVPLTILLMTL